MIVPCRHCGSELLIVFYPQRTCSRIIPCPDCGYQQRVAILGEIDWYMGIVGRRDLPEWRVKGFLEDDEEDQTGSNWMRPISQHAENWSKEWSGHVIPGGVHLRPGG